MATKQRHSLEILILGAFLLIGFNNCSKVQFDDKPLSKNGTQGVEEPPGGGTNPTPTPSPTPPGGGGGPAPQTTTVTLNSDKKVDLVLVIDNSGSMDEDAAHLASRLEGFVTTLENSSIDWQMCLITTDLGEKGNSRKWSGNSVNKPHILTGNNSGLDTIFKNTINGIFTSSDGSGDERGIATLNAHVGLKNTNDCYRPGVAVSSILISDEDERSSGGRPGGQQKPLEDIDKPLVYVDKVKAQLGNVPLLFNPIIVKSDDTTCLTAQKTWEGKIYEELAVLTGATAGSICDADYTDTLKDFADKIVTSVQSITLLCSPTTYTISSTPAIAGLMSHLTGNKVIIDSQIIQSTSFTVKYSCP